MLLIPTPFWEKQLKVKSEKLKVESEKLKVKSNAMVAIVLLFNSFFMFMCLSIYWVKFLIQGILMVKLSKTLYITKENFSQSVFTGCSFPCI